MFNPLRALLSFLGAADATTTEKSNNASIKDAPSDQAQDRDSTTGPAYRAAFNYAVPPPQYASGVFKTSSPPAPNSALSGYFFFRIKDDGTSTPRINNIPPPPVSMFGAPTENRTRCRPADSPPNSDDIDMPDACSALPPTPPKTPPRESDTQRSAEGLPNRDDQDAAAHENDTNESHNSTIPPTSVDRNERDDRPRLQPRRQKDRQRTPTTPQPPTDWVDEIVIEEDTPENNLPVGYLGTFRGHRHFIPEYPGMLPCSFSNKHLLICGHWVDSAETCGSNCRKQHHSHKPFNCPTCHEIVREVLTGSFPAAEATRLKELRKKQDIAFLACCVEQVVRAAPELKTGVTEAVAGFFYINYGRACKTTENPDPEGHDSIEWIVRDEQVRYQRKQCEKFARENPLNTHEKRNSDEETVNPSADADDSANDGRAATNEQTQSDSSRNHDEMQDSSPLTKKKQKTKLETHREPITSQTRGTKRRSSSVSSDDGSSTSTASPFASLSGPKPLYNPTPKKKLFVQPVPTFGEASFLIPPAHVAGPLLRERDSEVYVEGPIERESKRRRASVWPREAGKVSGKMSGSEKGFEAFRKAWEEKADEDDEL